MWTRGCIAANHYDFRPSIRALRLYFNNNYFCALQHQCIMFRAVTKRISYVRLRHGLFKVMYFCFPNMLTRVHIFIVVSC